MGVCQPYGRTRSLYWPAVLNRVRSLPANLRQYLIITANYWAFTLSDGALRMLVVLYFHQLGYDPLSIAALFLFYEAFGVVTNLVGGWLGALLGLNRTMHIGTSLQLVALAMLLVPAEYLGIPLVMASQALSGIAKDLNKMSAKSAIKSLVANDQQQALFRWVAILTGSKNTLKGVGFFIGGGLLSWLGFQGAVASFLALLCVIWLLSLFSLNNDLGRASAKPKFTQLLSVSRTINVLSAARLFLFASRDIWFVVALPVSLASQFGWTFWQVGGLMAAWVIGYGVIQAVTPRWFNAESAKPAVMQWGLVLSLMPLILGSLSVFGVLSPWMLIVGLVLYASLFAINSALHSYIIVAEAKHDGVSLDVGFYYMSNAMGRLLGTILSGAIYQWAGLGWCLLMSALAVLISALIARRL